VTVTPSPWTLTWMNLRETQIERIPLYCFYGATGARTAAPPDSWSAIDKHCTQSLLSRSHIRYSFWGVRRSQPQG
jgi:hypothetical protein